MNPLTVAFSLSEITWKFLHYRNLSWRLVSLCLPFLELEAPVRAPFNFSTLCAEICVNAVIWNCEKFCRTLDSYVQFWVSMHCASQKHDIWSQLRYGVEKLRQRVQRSVPAEQLFIFSTVLFLVVCVPHFSQEDFLYLLRAGNSLTQKRVSCSLTLTDACFRLRITLESSSFVPWLVPKVFPGVSGAYPEWPWIIGFKRNSSS